MITVHSLSILPTPPLNTTTMTCVTLKTSSTHDLFRHKLCISCILVYFTIHRLQEYIYTSLIFLNSITSFQISSISRRSVILKSLPIIQRREKTKRQLLRENETVLTRPRGNSRRKRACAGVSAGVLGDGLGSCTETERQCESRFGLKRQCKGVVWPPEEM